MLRNKSELDAIKQTGLITLNLFVSNENKYANPIISKMWRNIERVLPARHGGDDGDKDGDT